ncbi:MAG TPA: ChbG/HpnK family deacetylase [Terriglobia bacterium]|nr:ChbG/HpnK family deacetylase [Terriglobia bacterium]
MTQKKRQLIVTADDLGLTERVNEAIGKAHREGIVTAASLMVNGGAFESAIDILNDNPRLDAGLHLNLTEGRSVSTHEEIPSLANSSGFLYHHPFELIAAIVRRKVRLADLEEEIRAQLEKALTGGTRITHVDGHKHVHVVPQVFDLISRIAPDYGIRAVRSTIERTPRLYSLLARNFGSSPQILKQYFFGKALSGAFVFARSADGRRALYAPRRFYGITQTGFLDTRTFADIVARLPNGVSEVMCHPGYVDEYLKRTPTRLHFQRERELEFLTGRGVRDLLEHAGIALASYRDLGVCGNCG